MAEKRVEPVLKDLCKIENYEIIEKFKGKKLEGLKYSPVLKVPVQEKLSELDNAHRVILSIPVVKSKAYSKRVSKGEDVKEEVVSEFVTIEEGSGAVHTAPGHGPEDYYVGMHYGLPTVSPVDEEGKFTEEAGKFSGIFVKDANKMIIKDLEENGFLLYSGWITHPYPLCWRCKTPLIFRLSKQWFLSIDPIKEKMLEENEKVRWMPEFGKERFRKWVEDATDWCISRQRYWGIPMPVWVCKSCGHQEVIGSLDELKRKSIKKIEDDIDLHKNSVDKIKLKCEKCGGEMVRVPDVLDVWFDSGVSPWASLGYPFKNKELFERLWPVDLICESQDQIRGWFYSLMFCGLGVFGRRPYENVGMLGWVVDEKGEKMSKSKGNVVWANDGIKEFGSDVIRLYYCFGKAPWEIQFFSKRMLSEVRRVLNILWNSVNFFKTFKDNDFKPKLENLKNEDKWIVSKTNSLIKDVTEYMENFEFHKAGKALVDFIVEDVSRTYIKLIRDRVWITEKGDDKNAAMSALFYALNNVIRMLAPISSFVAEKLYKELGGNLESVFMEDWPRANERFINKELEENMDISKKIVEVVLNLRQMTKIKLRWPIQDVFVHGDDKIKKVVESFNDVIKVLSNAKKVVYGKPASNQSYTSVDTEFGSVFIQKELDKKLKIEALSREIIRRVQDVRKKNNFGISESIKLSIKSDYDDKLKELSEPIKKSVGAIELKFGNIVGEFKGSLEFDGKKIEFAFSRA